MKKNQSALLAKYFSMYKKNPRSKVFAPLAESFRKLGMHEDAYKILKDGLRNHPQYTLGYVVLAHCYYDQEKYELTYNTLRPIITQNTDNISLQKIFAITCIKLGYLDEALETYKYLLFMNPKDKFFADQVKKLEDDLQVGHKKISIDQLIKAPDLPTLNLLESNEDDWVQVNFANDGKAINTEDVSEIESNENWVMKKSGFGDHPILKEEKVKERSLEDEYFADEFEEDHGDIEEANQSIAEEPIISHTLIDLYCSQKYYDKAIELLNRIIELNPNDKATKAKLNSVMELKNNSNYETTTEDDGHDELIQIIETQVKSKSPSEVKIEKVFTNFLSALKDKSTEYR